MTGEGLSPLSFSLARLQEAGVLRKKTIQRIHTHGGQPPPTAECDASKQSAEIKSSYTADYYFYIPSNLHSPAHQ
jgi:hypothetical protein